MKTLDIPDSLFRDAVVIDKQHYYIIKHALPKDVCDVLSQYAILKARQVPNIKKRGDPLAQIHRAYGDGMMETLLERFTPLIESVTKRPLWPTLSFYYTYTHGNQLNRHTDRGSCEYVAGICLGVDPAYQASHGSWPLILEINGVAESVELDCGDLVVFRGYRIPHWREPFMGTWFVSAIFAYVDKEGPSAFLKYDQRKALGTPHIGMFRWAWGCLWARVKACLCCFHIN